MLAASTASARRFHAIGQVIQVARRPGRSRAHPRRRSRRASVPGRSRSWCRRGPCWSGRISPAPRWAISAHARRQPHVLAPAVAVHCPSPPRADRVSPESAPSAGAWRRWPPRCTARRICRSPALMVVGLGDGGELKLVLSAPALSRRRTSSRAHAAAHRERMKTWLATASMMGRIRSRPSLVAVMSRKVSSSAPCSL